MQSSTPTLMQQFDALSDEQRIRLARMTFNHIDMLVSLTKWMPGHGYYFAIKDSISGFANTIKYLDGDSISPAPAPSTDDKPLTGMDACGAGELIGKEANG